MKNFPLSRSIGLPRKFTVQGKIKEGMTIRCTKQPIWEGQGFSLNLYVPLFSSSIKCRGNTEEINIDAYSTKISKNLPPHAWHL